MNSSFDERTETTDTEEQAYLADLAKRVAASWPKDLPSEPLYAFGKQPLTGYVRGWAALQPEKPAIIFYGRKISFAELDRWSDGVAAWLQGHGVAQGDRVALFLPTCPQFTIAFLGILKARGVVVPVSSMTRRMELEHFLSDSGAKAVIAQDQLLQTVLALGEKRRPRILLVTALQDLLPHEPDLPVPPGFEPDAHAPRAGGSFLDAIQTPPSSIVSPDWGDPAVINYTGGTTGLPKGCVHAHGDLVYTGACTATLSSPEGAESVLLNYLPAPRAAAEGR